MERYLIVLTYRSDVHVGLLTFVECSCTVSIICSIMVLTPGRIGALSTSRASALVSASLSRRLKCTSLCVKLENSLPKQNVKMPTDTSSGIVSLWRRLSRYNILPLGDFTSTSTSRLPPFKTCTAHTQSLHRTCNQQGKHERTNL